MTEIYEQQNIFFDNLSGKPKNISELNTEAVKMRVLDWHTASKIIEENHYTHVAPPAQISLGFYIEGELSTVIMYANGANFRAAQGIMKGGKQEDMCELIRLFSFDWAPPNIESYCIGQSFKWLKENTKKKWLLSYADLNQKHIGFIYQATNWIYTGLGAKTKQLWTLDGKPIHTRTIWSHLGNSSDVELIKTKYAEMGRVFEVKENLLPKARYVYLLGNKRERKQMMESLKVPVFTKYPKTYQEALAMEEEMKN